MRNCLTKSCCIFEFGAVQTCVNLVDLVKSFQTSIYYLLFTRKNWRRYSRERASQSLPKIRQSWKQIRKIEKTQASILDDSSLFVDPIFDDVYEDEELDTDFWSWTPPSPEPVQRLWR